MNPDEVSTLTVPAKGSWLNVIRLFVASVADACGLDAEAIDDVRLVVTEICAEAPGTRQRTITVHAAARDGRLSFRCDGVMPLIRSDDPGDPHVLRARVLEALIPGATWIRTGDEPGTVLFDVLIR